MSTFNKCYEALINTSCDKLEKLGKVITPENINIEYSETPENLLFRYMAHYIMTTEYLKKAEWLISRGCDINIVFNNVNCLLNYCCDFDQICPNFKFFKKLVSPNTNFSLKFNDMNVIQYINNYIDSDQENKWYRVLIRNGCPQQLFIDTLPGNKLPKINQLFEEVKEEAKEKSKEEKQANETNENQKEMLKNRRKEVLLNDLPSVDGMISKCIESEINNLNMEMNSLNVFIEHNENSLKTLQHTQSKLKEELAATKVEIKETTDELVELKKKQNQYTDLAENLEDKIYKQISEKTKETVKNNLTKEELIELLQKKLNQD